MRLWYFNDWNWISVVGFMITFFAIQGLNFKAPFREIAMRIAGAVCGLAIILFAISRSFRG